MFKVLVLTKGLAGLEALCGLKMTVIVGPWLMTRWIAIPMATTAARIGMIQTTEILVPFLGSTHGLR